MGLLRRERVPEVVKAVALPERQRRLAWALTEDGQPVIAAEHALVLPGGLVVSWNGIERVSWKRPELFVWEIAEVEGTGTQHRLNLTGDGDLPEIVYTRVTGSIAWQRHEPLEGGGGFRLVGRRQPDRDALLWQVVFDAGTDPQDAQVREHALILLAAAQRTIG